MNKGQLPPIRSWLIEPLEMGVAQAIDRLRRAPDVQHMAIMPDVHLATDVCVGVVIGTSTLLYPQAVGGDIGCGMLAVAFDAGADSLTTPALAGRVLSAIGQKVSTLRRHRRFVIPMPPDLNDSELSHPSVQGICRDEGRLQLGTLGSGNHFIELQSDESGGLWLMIHSGSRVMGQAIKTHHLARAHAVGSGLKALDSQTADGEAYLWDVAWARRYAETNRRAMAEQAAEAMRDVLGTGIRWETAITTDHNHVTRETHAGRSLWVHRKGAMPAGSGITGVLPGSMATQSFHVEGRGNADSLCSSAHGAGRALSRERARKTITEQEMHRQMHGIWYDYRMASHLREEAPTAYKDIRAVLRAQHELVKVTRVLAPLLSYKGR